MFKNVFTKYISAFMVIIVVGFTILGIFVLTLFNNYSVNLKRDMMENMSNLVVNYLSSSYNVSTEERFNRIINHNYNLIKGFISTLSPFKDDDISILIVDLDGHVLINADRDDLDENIIINTIPKNQINRIIEKGGFAKITGLKGVVFKEDYLSYANPIIGDDSNVTGIVLVYSSSGSMKNISDSLIRTMVLTSLWVILISLVAVYFITEKSIGPIREMSKAAKSFSRGKFDVRVPVKGNDEIANLAKAFNNMAASLGDLENTRRTFLGNVSHDLRTPMTTISGFIDGILDGKIPPEKYHHYLSIVRDEVKRLSRLVMTLLDLTKIQAGERKIVFQPFDICEMARQILISNEQRIDKKMLDVEFETDEDRMIVSADKDAIYQIFYNICDNAVKFAYEKGKLRIRIIKRDKKIYVSVYNDGVGIPEDELPHVFDQFYKSDKSRGLDKTGVGLGMFIAKTIIDAHEQEIWVKSVHNEYCEFIFTLKPEN
ncbi:MAG: HAMP domain-containing histidine kinase [Clostridia bacterium]|nr:HAMP domain-containing histidine kinase [Clostridia bacterium]